MPVSYSTRTLRREGARRLVRLTDVSLTSDSAWRAGGILVQVPSAVVRATAGAPQVVVTPRRDSPVPEVEISLSENIWDLTTTGVGVTIGAVMAVEPAADCG